MSQMQRELFDAQGHVDRRCTEEEARAHQRASIIHGVVHEWASQKKSRLPVLGLTLHTLLCLQSCVLLVG